MNHVGLQVVPSRLGNTHISHLRGKKLPGLNDRHTKRVQCRKLWLCQTAMHPRLIHIPKTAGVSFGLDASSIVQPASFRDNKVPWICHEQASKQASKLIAPLLSLLIQTAHMQFTCSCTKKQMARVSSGTSLAPQLGLAFGLVASDFAFALRERERESMCNVIYIYIYIYI